MTQENMPAVQASAEWLSEFGLTAVQIEEMVKKHFPGLTAAYHRDMVKFGWKDEVSTPFMNFEIVISRTTNGTAGLMVSRSTTFSEPPGCGQKISESDGYGTHDKLEKMLVEFKNEIDRARRGLASITTGNQDIDLAFV